MYNAELTSPPLMGFKSEEIMSTERDLNEDAGCGSALNVGLDVEHGQIAESAGVDFESNKWTFQMPEGFRAGAGKYMIIKLTPKLINPVKKPRYDDVYDQGLKMLDDA